MSSKAGFSSTICAPAPVTLASSSVTLAEEPQTDTWEAVAVTLAEPFLQTAFSAVFVVIHRDVDPLGDGERPWVTAGFLQVHLGLIYGCNETFGVGRACAHPAVTVPDRPPEGVGVPCPQPDRDVRLLKGLGLHLETVELPELTLEMGFGLSPKRFHHVDDLGEPAYPLLR